MISTSEIVSMEVKKHFKITIAIVMIGLISLIIGGCSSNNNTYNDTSKFNSIESNFENNTYIEISVDEISNQAKFYSENIDGKEIRYFIVKDSNGNIKVAFDACDVCGGKKGYRQEGNDMICNNCGKYFNIDELGSKNVNGGGCWPSYLRHELDGNTIKISKEDLKKGGKYF